MTESSRERAAALRDVRDPEPRDRLGAAAAQARPSKTIVAAAPDGAGDRAQRRRLPGPVRAEDGDDLALLRPSSDTPCSAVIGP